MESKDKNKEKKRNKIIAVVLIIILLLLLLIKLYFEFRAEREILEEIGMQKSDTEFENQHYFLKNLIDSLCNIYPEECANFEKHGNVGNIMNYANSISDKQKRLNALIDSLCAADSINCEKYKTFTNIDDLQKYLDSLSLALNSNSKDSLQKLRDKEITDSIAREDELRRLRDREKALRDSLCAADSINCEKCKDFTDFDDFKRCLDSLQELRDKEIADSIANASKKICIDTVAPWVYPEPTGGLYFEPLKVRFFVSEENSSVFYKFSDDAEFRQWNGEMISISQNTELFYYAIDSCENKFEEQKKVYEFREKQTQNTCPDGMTLVESSNGNFCIDQYEWANKKGARPTNMISQAAARDSCLAVGKRLCTADEWTTACKGQHNWKYPYGDKYINHACVTQDTTYRGSAVAGECRGWYAIYDMTGNLAEWTSTRSEDNNRFFIVKGGFWESGAAATCEMSRYSYYPQNQHTPVGFRCCKSLEN